MTATSHDQMLGWVLDLPEQIRASLRRARETNWPGLSGAPRAVFLGGMGGSGAAARLAGLIHGETRIPVVADSDPIVPGWVGPEDLVVIVSFSGRTWEALALATEAVRRGVPTRAVTSGGDLAPMLPETHRFLVPGGRAPRAALGSMFVPVLLTLDAVFGTDSKPELESVAAELDRDVLEYRGSGTLPYADPAAIADVLDAPLPHVYAGSSAEQALARRWQTQVQENAKRPVCIGYVPELAHNDVMSWARAVRDSKASFVFLDAIEATEPTDEPARDVRRRRARTERSALEEIQGLDARLVQISVPGVARARRVLAQVLLGDLVSLELARRDGTDPLRIDAIDRLKARALPAESSGEGAGDA